MTPDPCSPVKELVRQTYVVDAMHVENIKCLTIPCCYNPKMLPNCVHGMILL